LFPSHFLKHISHILLIITCATFLCYFSSLSSFSGALPIYSCFFHIVPFFMFLSLLLFICVQFLW
jgi:hypothetical protein